MCAVADVSSGIVGESAGFVWVCAIGERDSKNGKDDAEIWCGDHA
jgi:hypothetical protein